uniref:Uncharacterized protein n=1 Tax=Ditylenchus dipsaci TaxID=166011 RepID=A0A915E6H5_9BILA
MLLTGCISYERVVEKLSSLEPIMLQEQEYLKIQVDRITSRKVSLLLVENSVASTASEMLLKEGIALATNIKHKVMERVALATNSDIITSLDTQFLQPRIGFVPDFSQRQFTKVDGSDKKILVLDNCLGNFGATILLYGSSSKELISAKRVLKFLLLSRYSSELEMSFLAMFNSTSLVNIKKKKVSSNSTQQCVGKEERKEEIFKCNLCQYNLDSLESEAKDDENSSVSLTRKQLTRFTDLEMENKIQNNYKEKC